MQTLPYLELLGKARQKELLAEAEHHRMIRALRQAQPARAWWPRLRSLKIVFAARRTWDPRFNCDGVCNGPCVSRMVCCPSL
jgi:hypothetical protein